MFALSEFVVSAQ